MMLNTRRFGLALVLLLSGVGVSAFAQEGPAWPPPDGAAELS